MTARRAILRVTWRMIRRELRLPADTKLIAVLPLTADGVVEFVLEQPTLPDCEEGERYPCIAAQYRTDDAGEVTFEGWR